VLASAADATSGVISSGKWDVRTNAAALVSGGGGSSVACAGIANASAATPTA
jgi:hypothetical protein